jgi:hypothetical protein
VKYAQFILLISLSQAQTGEFFPQAAADGAWTWFTDPRALYYLGQEDKTYCGFLTRDGSTRIWSYDHRTAKTDTFTLHEKFKADDHNNPALYIRKDRRIMAFYQKHSTDSLVLYRVSQRPEDISGWEPERTLKMSDAVGYAHVFRIEDRLFLFSRSIDYHPTLITSDDEGETWNAPTKIISGSGQRPYIKYVSDGKRRLHFAFTDGHPRDEWSNSIYYAYLEAGAYYRADGTKIKDFTQGPIDPKSESELVYDGNTSGRAWIWDIALDSKGFPIVVFVVFPANNIHLYYYGRWDGARWTCHKITEGGSWYPQTPAGQSEPEPNYSAGLILDHDDPDDVYLSKPQNGIFEIEAWSTKDLGETWRVKKITQGSAKHNARPILPWNLSNARPTAKMLLWMNGDYIFYKDYATNIRYTLLSGQPVSILPRVRRQHRPLWNRLVNGRQSGKIPWTGPLPGSRGHAKVPLP